MKLGRNEACHCGSGKKYKKCCLLKDLEQEKEQEKIAKNPESEWMSEEDLNDGPFIDEGIDMDDFEEEEKLPVSYPSEEVEKYSGKGYIDNEYPEISKKDEKKVDAWWEKYDKMKSPEGIKQHLNDFLGNNPKDVIINLGLEHDVLFELIGDFLKQGNIDEIIPYMMQFREKYPEVYIKSAGYYDSDIIAWLISKNRADEVVNYLNYFEQYPINNIDKLFEIINLLLATNHAEIITPLIKKVYNAVWYSNEVMGGYEIADSLIAEIYSKYLKKTNSISDLEKLVEELKGLGLEFDDDFHDTNFWNNRINFILKDYEKWDEKPPKKKSQIFEKIYRIFSNFTRFLNEEKNISYSSAHYYGKLLSQYYGQMFDSEKRPKSMFLFPEKQMDKIISEMTRDFLSINIAKALVILNVLYYFAEYLLKCGNYTEAQKNEMQNSTQKLFNSIYKSSLKTTIETAAFYRFPLFG